MYIVRHADAVLQNLRRHFGAVLVTGPRQAGKTTLVNEAIIKAGRRKINQVTLDDPVILETAINEAGSFFKDYKPPVFVDEIQYAPNLFHYIKMIIDKEKKSGLFFLSGSQQFSLMKGISETMAGRVGIVDILGLSLREINNDPFSLPFTPERKYVDTRSKSPPKWHYDALWGIIWRGTLPKLYADPGIPAHNYYASYLRTYMERDVRALLNIGDEKKFLVFIRSAAARTGQMLNLTKMADDADISRSTAERWLSILMAANIVFLLRPFYTNIGKRDIKTPKLYFLETGLISYLIGWDTPKVLRNGAMGGASFETFVIAEILKSYINKGIQAPLYYYRDKDNREIDLLIWRNGFLFPIEIKMTSNPGKNHIASFGALNKLASPYLRGQGALICCCDRPVSLNSTDLALPVGYI